jgi:hypothetical protein
MEIARCPAATEICSGGAPASHPCNTIVTQQTGVTFQVPEPWSGLIDVAPILFISSNPSIDEFEMYPDQSWNPERLTDFFQNRFTSSAGWVRSGLYALRQNGSYSDKWVRFWASTRARAREILGRGARPGVDYALTEVVRCKSRNELGVKEAQRFCSSRYLPRTLSVAKARALIVYGVPAKNAIYDQFGSTILPRGRNLGSLSIAGIDRILAFLPHPNERGSKKTLEANLGIDGLAVVRDYTERKK